ncbi:MAG: hypothetical protein ACE5FU_09630, partial [Nitrospinota bacterium]
HNSNPATPGWNRALSGATYQTFESSSMQAAVSQPDGSSRLCLSCHDGTIALGDVFNRPGAGLSGSSLQLEGGGLLTGDGKLAPSTTGGTSFIGTDLTNDHPVSFVYDEQLSADDGELVNPNPAALELTLKLSDGKVQCTTCHDPHDDSLGMFLKAPLVQTDDMATTGNDAQICLLCHDKKESPSGNNYNWIGSTHQSSTTASVSYKSGNYLGKTGMVWQDACLACHDTHSVLGSRRLLLEGTSALTDQPNTLKQQGQSAMEETCYLCHTGAAESILAASPLLDIKAEFSKLYHMPITTLEQADKTAEVHDVTDANLEEITVADYPTLKKTPNLDVSKRHVECSDCHNPHRIVKRTRAEPLLGFPGQGTHNHMIIAGPHNNFASGVLRGTWGVDPFESAPFLWPSWEDWPFGVEYSMKGTINSGPLTKEYQLCLKCHSSFAFGDVPPQPGSTGGGTPFGENDVETYTDQAKEFKPNNNGFHPVIGATGRDMISRNITSSPFLYPWGAGANANNIGSQTMYCSDCHGTDVPAGAGFPDPGPWGPHGSANKFLLMGTWDFFTGTPSEPGAGVAPQGLCFKCHNVSVYAPPSLVGAPGPEFTGFSGFTPTSPTVKVNLHSLHATSYLRGKLDVWESQNGILAGAQNYEISCMTCHVGQIHGFSGSQPRKGYMLLASMTAKLSACTVSTDPELCIDPIASDEKPYRTSRTRLRSEDRDSTTGWGTSGNWTDDNCSVAHNGGNTIAGGCRL